MLVFGVFAQMVFFFQSVNSSVRYDVPSDIVKAQSAQPPEPVLMKATIPALQPVVDSFTQEHTGYFGIYAKNLSSGEVATNDADTETITASLYKLVSAYLALQKVDRGELSLSQSIGNGHTLESCINLAISISDNPCGYAVRRAVNDTQLPANLKAAGLKATHLPGSYPTTTARDMGVLLENIHTGKGLKPESQKFLLAAMQNQHWRTRIPSGLPDTAKVGNKTGDLNGFAHDAAIVTKGNTTYLLVVLSGPSNNTAHQDQLISELSSNIYKSVN